MLIIRNTKVFHGPNLWAPVPAIVMEVGIGDLEDRSHAQNHDVVDRLIALVPSLSDPGALFSQSGDGLPCLLLDRLALALQNMARARVAQRDLAGSLHLNLDYTLLLGAEVTYGQTHPTDERGVCRVVYEYAHDEVGLEAGRLAVRLFTHLMAKREPTFDVSHEFDATLLPLAMAHAYRWQAGAILEAARRRGIPIERLDPGPGFAADFVQLGHGCYQRRIFSGGITSETAALIVGGTVTSQTPSLGVKLADVKALTHRLLRAAGLPVPDFALVRDVDGAALAAATIGYPVVVKPLDAAASIGVTVDVRDEAELRAVFELAQRASREGGVMVERFIPGSDYRILVVDNQVVSVLERVVAHVIGDGWHTVAELVDLVNADPHRGTDPDQPLKPITLDAQTLTVLAKQHLTPDAVPDAGRVVRLKPFGIMALGGNYIDRTDQIHPDNAAIARQAAQVIGLDIAGIDVITPDIARSAYDQGGAINEVNGSPALSIHTHPVAGQPRDVGTAIITMLFPPGQPVRVPIVAVTGTTGTTPTTRLLAHILQTAGKMVGMTTSEGIGIGGTRIAAGDMTSAAAARTVLRNPAVDCAVLETAPASILRDGLGFDHCAVGIVTDIGVETLGRDGVETREEAVRVMAVVLRAVVPDGASILDADDPCSVALAEAAGGEILFVAREEHHPVISQHVRQGGRAVVLRQTPAGEVVMLLADGEETGLLAVEELPATSDGCLPLARALPAIAAALAQDVPLEMIRSALRCFGAVSA